MDAFMCFSLTHSYLFLTEILVSSVFIVTQQHTKDFLKAKNQQEIGNISLLGNANKIYSIESLVWRALLNFLF